MVSFFFKKKLKNSIKVKLETQEVEVSYEAVDRTVDEIWATKPKVVVHVGVAGMRKSIDLEMKSFNGPYNGKDVLGKVRDPLCVDGPGNYFHVFKLRGFILKMNSFVI